MKIQVPKEVFSFLRKLEKNNNRDWFTKNKSEFKALETEIKGVYSEVFDKLNKHDEVDKMKIFRIYRDVRFSKDKTPYKTHFGGSFARVKPRLRGGYYLHLGPGESFLAAGFWEPNKDDLFRIRKELELDAKDFRKIINSAKFKNVWGPLVGDEVKTAPKGFNKEHPSIDLIRKKQFIFTKKFSDAQVLSSGFIDEVGKSFKAIRPYFDYMSEVLTTDLNGVSTVE